MLAPVYFYSSSDWYSSWRINHKIAMSGLIKKLGMVLIESKIICCLIGSVWVQFLQSRIDFLNNGWNMLDYSSSWYLHRKIQGNQQHFFQQSHRLKNISTHKCEKENGIHVTDVFNSAQLSFSESTADIAPGVGNVKIWEGGCHADLTIEETAPWRWRELTQPNFVHTLGKLYNTKVCFSLSFGYLNVMSIRIGKDLKLIFSYQVRNNIFSSTEFQIGIYLIKY